MGADQPRWCHVGRGQVQHQDCDSRGDSSQTVDGPQAPKALPHMRWAADSNGSIVARSQIVVLGPTATLMGTMTNETGSDVYFNGMPPYVTTFDTDGSERILLGDFNSPPQHTPTPGHWVMHPGASVPYSSLPVTLRCSHLRWEGADWSTSSQSTTMHIMTFCERLDIMTFCTQRGLPTIQLLH